MSGGIHPTLRRQSGHQRRKFFGRIANIDDNFGRLITKLDEWGIARDTLVIFMTDNGGTVGVKIFNAGMRGAKNTPYEGGVRVPSFWRWPAGFAGGRDCAALTAHVDILPTLAQVTGVKLPDIALDGRSLLPLLKHPQADWPDRFLFTHIGRWEKGRAGESKFANCAVRNSRFRFVNNQELYDLKTDPGEMNNVIGEHPEVVTRVRAAYDQWWSEILPALENEDVVVPKVNAFKAAYWKQFGGGPEAQEDGIYDVEHAWSPASNELAILLSTSSAMPSFGGQVVYGDTHLILFDANQKQITKNFDGDFASINWSPDGRYILYQTPLADDQGYSPEACVLDVQIDKRRCFGTIANQTIDAYNTDYEWLPDRSGLVNLKQANSEEYNHFCIYKFQEDRVDCPSQGVSQLIKRKISQYSTLPTRSLSITS